MYLHFPGWKNSRSKPPDSDSRCHPDVLGVEKFKANDCDTDNKGVVATFKERLPVRKQTSHKFYTGRCSVKGLKFKEREQCRVEITNSFALSEGLDTEVGLNSDWGKT
jgi:hypothetical protein